MLDLILSAIGKSMPFGLDMASLTGAGTEKMPGAPGGWQTSVTPAQPQGPIGNPFQPSGKSSGAVPQAPALPAAPDPRRQVSMDGLLAAINKRSRLGV